ncbi:hypothetical protein [Streptomyces sp. TE33382]
MAARRLRLRYLTLRTPGNTALLQQHPHHQAHRRPAAPRCTEQLPCVPRPRTGEE